MKNMTHYQLTVMENTTELQKSDFQNKHQNSDFLKQLKQCQKSDFSNGKENQNSDFFANVHNRIAIWFENIKKKPKK